MVRKRKEKTIFKRDLILYFLEQEIPVVQLVGENSAGVLNNKEPFNDEILNTFTAELAHIAYFGVSLHIRKYCDKKIS